MRALWLAACMTCSATMPAAYAAQDGLETVFNAGENTLTFDWPAIRIGTGEYPQGPTGVTVFHFPKRALGAVDVRGGGPGTVNTDYLRLGYTTPELDTVVFSGGSWYGLENTTAVATALKDDGVRDGTWVDLALSVGAIIYDFGDRRLNEIYPDKALAQGAYRAARPGVFPLGAHGAGRFAMTGSLFGCNAHSGQGGAFRQLGPVKIATFVVVNALGVVTSRDGRVAACFGDTAWPTELRAADLLAGYPQSRKPGWTASSSAEPERRNTTISLVVTNQKLEPWELQRLAVMVHTSMARALQPFATEFDGDVLYAVSTAEFDGAADNARLPLVDLGVVASETMWDAILSSVPVQPTAAKPSASAHQARSQWKSLTGDYEFSPFVTVRVTIGDDGLYAKAVGARKAYAIGRDAPERLVPAEGGDYLVTGRYPLTLRFTADRRLTINPGHWQQIGTRK